MSVSAAVKGDTGRAELHSLGGKGGAPDLLFVHGFGSDRFAWAANAPAFFNTHAVWAVELPGHTAAPIDAGEGRARSMAEAVATCIEGRLQVPVPVVAHSLGGAVAAELAKAHPELVSGLFLIAPAGFGVETNSRFIRAFPGLETREEAQPILEMLASNPRLINAQMVQYVLGFLGQPGRRDALAVIANALAAQERISPLPEMPVKAIWGDQDAIHRFDQLAAAEPHVSVEIIEGAGHLPHIEKARQVDASIAAFVEALAR